MEHPQKYRLFAGILFTLLLTYLLHRIQVPNPNVILITAIVFFTFWGGFYVGIPSGVITLAYSAYFFLMEHKNPSNINKFIVICIFIPIIILMVGILKRRSEIRNKELCTLNDQLQKLTNLDGLTHIPNRRSLDQFFQKAYHNAASLHAKIAYVMIDIDLFKQYNDRYGHLAGDECLIRVASCLYNEGQRRGFYVARYGGEEFALVLTAENARATEEICEKAKEAIQSLQILHDASKISAYVTVSIGAATTIATDTNSSEQLMEYADKALYQAKTHGRNCIYYSS